MEKAYWAYANLVLMEGFDIIVYKIISVHLK